MTRLAATATAPANFALSKYWGKRDAALREPSVPSLSVCVEGLTATATVRFHREPGPDRCTLQGRPADARTLARVRRVLDAVRSRSTGLGFAEVRSESDFPVAAGLASSAAGLAAVAGAAWCAAGLASDSLDAMALVARLGSGSACRSIHGGFVAWEPGPHGSRVYPVAPPEHWPLELCIVQVSGTPKEVGSTEGMEHALRTSPMWEAWLRQAPEDFAAIARAVSEKDFAALTALAEANCLLMHATTITARPAVFYLNPTSLEVLDAVLRIRRGGLFCFFTMDAGPNVKVFCPPGLGDDLADALRAELGEAVLIRRSRVGGGLRLLRGDP